MAHLSLHVFGPLQLTLDGIPLSLPYHKVRLLLIYLAVEAQRAHSRTALAGLLWPDAGEAEARRSLSQALFHLRAALRRPDSEPSFLLIQRDTLQFNAASDHDLDVQALRAWLTACESHAHHASALAACATCLARLREACALYGGDFLQQGAAGSELFEDWTRLVSEDLHRRVLEALSVLADTQEGAGDYRAAISYTARQIALEPWREEAHRQMMRLLAACGERSRALAQYETCRRVLAAEFGITPSPATTALHLQIRDGLLPPGPAAQRKIRSAAPRLARRIRRRALVGSPA